MVSNTTLCKIAEKGAFAQTFDTLNGKMRDWSNDGAIKTSMGTKFAQFKWYRLRTKMSIYTTYGTMRTSVGITLFAA